MRTRFYIEKRKDEDGRLLLRERPVFMSVTLGGDRVMLSTGIRSDFSQWDPENQRIKSEYPNALGLNAWLKTLSNTADRVYHSLQTGEGPVSADEFRLRFNELKPKYSSSFFEVFYNFMDSGSHRWADATYLKVRTIYNHLRDFEMQSGRKLSFGQMNKAFLRDFAEFYSKKGNNPRTTAKAVNIIVWFLNWATREEYNNNLEYREFYKELPAGKGEVRIYHYLRWEELMNLSKVQCTSRKEERVRDVYCFMCFSGIRYSELQKLRKEDVIEEEVILRSEGRKIRRIPLNRMAADIYKQYRNRYNIDNTAFPLMSVFTFNKYLRILGGKAGIGRMVRVLNSQPEMRPLYEVLTTGTAVHTFIHNALELGIPAEIISKYTGIGQDSRIQALKSSQARNEILKFDK